jgi:predicted oxidoreductase
MIWSPLGGGRLFRAQDEQSQRVRAVLEDLGHAHGVSPATMSYAWIRRHPSKPLPITGSGRIDALREAVAALDVQLSADDWYRVWRASTNREVE